MSSRPSSRHDSDWEGIRLHVVTGKGGTGKTTVAGALALALAADGRRTLLCEVEGRQGLAQLFDVPPLPYEERRIAVAPGNGDVFALTVEPKAALLEYLDLFYHLGRAGKILERTGAIDFATTVAPGLRDVLLTGKVYEAARRRDASGPVYDAVVLDAPPTGRITRFLNVNEEVVGLAKVGPIRNQANSIMTLLRSPQTAVHLVTVLEEMPVQETQDAVAELGRVGLRVGGVVVNMVREPILPARALTAAVEDGLDRDEVVAGLEAAGLGRSGRRGTATRAGTGTSRAGTGTSRAGTGTTGRAAEAAGRVGLLVDGLLIEAAQHGVRVALESLQRRELASLDRPTYELPAMPGGIDPGALYELAERLTEQGMA